MVLFRPPHTQHTDDAGTTIIDTVHRSTSLPGPYAYLRPPSGTLHPASAPTVALAPGPGPSPASAPSHCQVPSLTAICIHLLFPHPHHLSSIAPLRLPHRPDLRLLHPLLPTLPAFVSAQVDPRLWATLVQLYDSLPASFATYSVPLQDIHLPLLQSIPSTSSFSLVTILELPACPELTDDSIVHLKFLHSLAAFDASHTALTNYAIMVLKSTLHLSHCPPPALPYRGPCSLRVLALRNCKAITNDACTTSVPFRFSLFWMYTIFCDFHPFQPAETASFYHPTSLSDVLDALASSSPAAFSSKNRYTLRVDRLYHLPPFHLPRPVKPVTSENSVVVLPSAIGSVKLNPPPTPRLPTLARQTNYPLKGPSHHSDSLNSTTPDRKPSTRLKFHRGFSRTQIRLREWLVIRRGTAYTSVAHKRIDGEDGVAAREEEARLFYQQKPKLLSPSSYEISQKGGPQFNYTAKRFSPRTSSFTGTHDHLLMLYRDPPPWDELETRMKEAVSANAAARELAMVKRAGAHVADIERIGQQAQSKRQQIELLEREVKRRRVSEEGLCNVLPIVGASSTSSKNPFRRRQSDPMDATYGTAGRLVSRSRASRDYVGTQSDLTPPSSGSKPLIPISRVKIPQLSKKQWLEASKKQNTNNKMVSKKEQEGTGLIKGKRMRETDQSGDEGDNPRGTY
ncbi:hypothetical protein BDQ17DRAFT_1325144 [Cyathus striatus]|nr:hypothetical protein BDQ17DRAFT_1325144 [Cyathus striatus]